MDIEAISTTDFIAQILSLCFPGRVDMTVVRGFLSGPGGSAKVFDVLFLLSSHAREGGHI